MRKWLLALGVVMGATMPGVAGVSALTIYPIDQAEILAGSLFDFKVELDGVASEGDVKVVVNGADHALVFGRAAEFTAREKGVEPDPPRRSDRAARLIGPGGWAFHSARATSI
jgi:alkaline phosphatase